MVGHEENDENNWKEFIRIGRRTRELQKWWCRDSFALDWGRTGLEKKEFSKAGQVSDPYIFGQIIL